MIIGLCGAEFPEVRRHLRAALPEAELVELGVGACEVPAVDVLVPLGASVGAELMDATRPRLIQQFGVGLQGVDAAAARGRAIPVAFVPAADTGNAVAVAETAMLHLLMLLRRYADTQVSVAERRVGHPSGNMLAGKAVTVLGTGAIGTALLARLSAFDAVTAAVGRRGYRDYPALHGLLPAGRFYSVGEFRKALAGTEVLIVCCPLTEETLGMVGVAALAAMPRGGWVINVGRGPIVEYRALLGALRSGQLAGAGLDVAWEEPIDPGDPLLRENVCVTPHIGGVTEESYAAMAATFAVNARRAVAGEPLSHLAD
ncbi:NAD(P)-dependent oxidoreductase [Nocardia sp. NPDC051052]|uniref:NAD(P)-dependent oxidoreductase n=1 Tax=Nocardia sp. NPDC051052 TaxID=3364322 RepID=UPI00379B4AC2